MLIKKYDKDFNQWRSRTKSEMLNESLVGLSVGSLSALSCLGLNYLIGSFNPELLFAEAIVSLLAGVFSMIPACKHNLTDVPTKRYEIQTGEKFKNFMHNKFEGYTSKKYIFNTEDNLNTAIENMKNEMKGCEAQHNIEFLNIISKYPDTNDYNPKSILNILQDKDIKPYIDNGSAFNFKIDSSGNTLLTSFFDIVPNDGNREDYNHVINIIKSTKGIDYEQKDGFGISILEKVLNSENLELFNIIKDYSFTYFPDIDNAYKNIADKRFKFLASKLNIKFPDLDNAAKNRTSKVLELVQKQLNSPFCNRDYYEKLLFS